MKPLVLLSTLLLASSMACAQTKYNLKKMKTEALDRGVVAVRLPDDKVAVSWRILSDDHKHEAFDVYRNGERLTAQPMTKGGAFFIDEKPLKNEDATYEVRVTNAKHGTVAPVGSFSLCSDAPIGYFTIPLSTPQGEGRTRYTANDASVGDVDGDGQYEIFLKWEPRDIPEMGANRCSRQCSRRNDVANHLRLLPSQW